MSTQAFHFLDHPRALAEFRRVVTTGGWLLIGMIDPSTTGAARRSSRLLSRVTGTRMVWPTRQELARLMAAAGFEVRAQRRVGAASGRLVPTVVTVARAS